LPDLCYGPGNGCYDWQSISLCLLIALATGMGKVNVHRDGDSEQDSEWLTGGASSLHVVASGTFGLIAQLTHLRRD